MKQEDDPKTRETLVYTARSVTIAALLILVCSMILWSTACLPDANRGALASVKNINAQKPEVKQKNIWSAPEESSIPGGENGDLIRYGKELISHTSKYFGPEGSVARISNGMNCQNCHLSAGTKLFANNYAVFYAAYPKKAVRSGLMEQPVDRIEACFSRSLNGRIPDKSSREIKAMLAYLQWVGSEYKKGQKIFGTATEKLKYLDRAADPAKGLLLYNEHCTSCHGKQGEGLLAQDKKTYLYPPLWGEHSYNTGAGMYRLSNFAGFVKNNMPFGISYESPVLTDEACWDLAAYVNSRPRPHKDPKGDYPDLKTKPIDAPFGPYADEFSEQQHKYGPFGPIAKSKNH